MDEKVEEGVIRWFGYVERMENDRIVKRAYVGKCGGSLSVLRPRKRWIDTVNSRQLCRRNGGGL